MDSAATPRGGSSSLHLVCMGSSAGGLEALSAFLRDLPPDLPCCYVIAQHAAPAHDSPLPQLLGRDTTMDVRFARDGMSLDAGLILVAPPGTEVTVDGPTVRVSGRTAARGPSPSVNVLMASAAETWGRAAIGVVLSGTGEDGAAGVMAIRAAGGSTIAQQPGNARFAGMPDAAIATGAVDLVLRTDEIGPALRRLAVDGRPAGQAADRTAPVFREPFEHIIAAVLTATGVDFTGYKRATLRRQIERRMGTVAVSDLASYRDIVIESGQEALALAASLLVTVTSFFRDPQAWEALRGPLSELLAEEDRRGPLRVWVPGCATGPEAYSLGMIIGDLLGDPGTLARHLKIFATDLNEDALLIARSGLYPDDAVQAVPPAMRARWLRHGSAGWEIVPALRDCVVFARHNVALDPPFPKINLISLRNTLIYFESALQERVLQLLHFSLAPGGLLLLGESERVIENHDLFETVDAKDRIYRRRPTATLGLLPTPQLRPAELSAHMRRLGPGRGDDREVVRDALISHFTPPSLVLGDNDEVIEVVGDVSRWCRLSEGRHSSHVVALVREELRTEVRALVLRVRQSVTEHAERSIPTDDGEVVVSVRHLGHGDDPATPGRVIVSFSGGRTHPPPAQPRPVPDRPDDRGIAGMLRELASTEAALQATIEQLSTSNEELQALNEELQAAGEELQASNEEVRASNEELEATNEELSSLNSELQQRGNDLSTANSDLENIQASLTSGLVLVDRDLRVMRYTPLAVRLFALIETDIGRTLTAIPSTIDIPDLEARLRTTIDDQHDGLLELRSDRVDMLLHFHPYRGGDGDVRGAIVVSTDISEVSTAHRVAQQRLRDLVAVTEALPETVWQRADDGRLLFLTSQVEDLYGLKRLRVLDNPGLLLAAVHPDDRDRVALAAAAIPDRPYELEYRVSRPNGQVRWVHESVVPVPPDEIGPGYSVSSSIDVTDQREDRDRVDDELATLDAVFHNSVFGVLVLDADNRVVRANEVFARMSGYDRSSVVGMPIQLVAQDSERLDAEPDPAAGTGPPSRLTMGVAHRRLIARDGTPYSVTMETRALHPDGRAKRVVIVHDVTRLHEANTELTVQARYDEQTGLLARGHFRALLAQELARADRGHGMVAVLWIDLDGFKQVNDRYGHPAGDLVLREIATRLRQLTRRQDAVGRLGGDEFAMLVTDIDQVDGLEPIAHRVLSALREPIQLLDSQIHLSGSIGVALAPADGRDPDALLHSADTAMYAAKQAGSDRRAYFQADMNLAAERRAGARQDLAAAVRARQFVMYYQPVVDIDSGKLSSVEALIRWVRNGDIVTAGEFMGVAEQTGQLRAIGAIAIDLIDADLRILRDDPATRHLSVCVNLAPSQLDERDILDRLLSWEPVGGFELIVIEVTEAAALARGGRAVETLTLLSKLGARLSIDDFGTGYSNLALLDRLRPSLIKIDRTLLVGAVDQPRGEAVLRAAVQLAQALEAEVVVEGVEDERLWKLTRTLGAEHAQGFHIARPMPLADLIEWVRP